MSDKKKTKEETKEEKETTTATTEKSGEEEKKEEGKGAAGKKKPAKAKSKDKKPTEKKERKPGEKKKRKVEVPEFPKKWMASSESRRHAPPTRFEVAAIHTAVDIIPGKGSKLKDIGRVCDNIERRTASDETLKGFHHLVFGRAGKKFALKKNLLEFSGIVEKPGVRDGRERLEEKLNSRTKKFLKDLCKILDLSSSGDSEELTVRIVDFLEEPKGAKKRKRSPSPSPSKGKKKRKTEKGAKSDESGESDEEEQSDKETKEEKKEESKKGKSKEKKKSGDDKADEGEGKKEVDKEEDKEKGKAGKKKANGKKGGKKEDEKKDGDGDTEMKDAAKEKEEDKGSKAKPKKGAAKEKGDKKDAEDKSDAKEKEASTTPTDDQLKAEVEAWVIGKDSKARKLTQVVAHLKEHFKLGKLNKAQTEVAKSALAAPVSAEKEASK